MKQWPKLWDKLVKQDSVQVKITQGEFLCKIVDKIIAIKEKEERLMAAASETYSF